MVGLHFAADNLVLSSFKSFRWAPKNYVISARVSFRPFKVIQVIDFGANRMRVCDFLLVRHGHSNLGPILHRFGDIAGFFVLLTTPLFNPNFGGVPVAPDRPC